MTDQTSHIRWKRTAAPSATVLAVTVDELKASLGIIDDTSQDSDLASLIREVTEQIEKDARIVVMTQTWQGYADEFPCDEIEIRKWPVQSLTFVKYITGGVLTTLSSALYQTDFISAPARILPIWGSRWPSTDYGTVNAVQLEAIVGYASAAAVPDYLKSVIRNVAVAKWHGCEMEGGYDVLIDRLQRFGFMQ